jgi:cell division protein FtsL
LIGRARKESDCTSVQRERIKLLLIVLLSIMIAAEGYYIYLLQDKIAVRNDEINSISAQLQHLKTEREDLKLELSREKNTGETDHGNTSDR